jgi:hypothetical protein
VSVGIGLSHAISKSAVVGILNGISRMMSYEYSTDIRAAGMDALGSPRMTV